jgi:AcrR family transcriptional regulator
LHRPPLRAKLAAMAKDTKDRIRRAALALFVAHGYDAATTRQIAAGADLSEGAIYRHYPGKDDIARDLFVTMHRRITALVAQAADGAASIEDAVSGVVKTYCALADEDWVWFSFHLLSLHRFLSFWNDADSDPVSEVAALIRAAIDTGELPPGDPELLAGMALGVVTQVAQNKAYGRLHGGLSAHAHAFTVAILAILRAR